MKSWMWIVGGALLIMYILRKRAMVKQGEHLVPADTSDTGGAMGEVSDFAFK